MQVLSCYSFLMKHRRVLSAHKPLHVVFHRRPFSTKPDIEDDWDTEFDHKLGPSDRFRLGDSSDFMQNVDIAAYELSRDLDIGLLRFEFERDYRPSLAYHCLMLPYTLDHDMTAFIHGPVHGMSKLNVLYLSSLDVMLRVKGLKESERKPFIDYIINRRVLIADDWLKTYGNIEFLTYDFHQSGTSFVRGECDAAFELKQPQSGQALGRIIKKGIAKLAYIIWKEKELVCARVFEDVPCDGSAFAEVLSALALLMKCEQEQFDLVEVWSDSARACGVMTGSQTIKVADPDRDACMLLRSMHTRFSKLKIVHKPRELMFLADQLLKMDSYTGSCPIKKAIQMWSSSLKGSPIFRISNNKSTTDTIDTFGRTQARKEGNEGYRYLPRTTFFLKVESQDKFEALLKLRMHFA